MQVGKGFSWVSMLDGFVEFAFHSLFVLRERTRILVFGQVAENLAGAFGKGPPFVLRRSVRLKQRGRVIISLS